MNRKANCAITIAITFIFVFIFIFILIIVIIIITGKPYPDAVGTLDGRTPPGWGLSGLIWIII